MNMIRKFYEFEGLGSGGQAKPLTPSKAKEIIDRYGEYLVKEFKNEPSVDKWLATPEAAALLSGEDWISVKDRLPEFGKRVLVWYYPIHPVMEGQLIGIDYRREYEHLKGSIRNRLEDNKGFAIGTITHFMPLPEPPKP